MDHAGREECYFGRAVQLQRSLIRACAGNGESCKQLFKEGGTVAQFFEWSLAQLEDVVSLDELALGSQVDDETLALSYLFVTRAAWPR